MSNSKEFNIKFWGTRGSIPCPGPSTVKYGGNTTSFELNCGGRRILVDAGTGIRMLGKEIMLKEGNLLNADLFFTHTHMDHIQGLPFFAPLYNPESDVRLHAGHLDGITYDLQGIIGTMLMKDPVFPVPSSLIEQACSFKDFECGKDFKLSGGVVVKTAPLNHPNGACGYRIEFGGKVLAICTDTEHFENHLDENVLFLADGADLLIYDAAYTDEEYPNFKGWGHSTWQEGYKTARQLNVKNLVLSGFNPDLSDDDLDKIALATKEMQGNTIVAVEGESLTL